MTLSEFKQVVNRPIIWANSWAMVTFEAAGKLSPQRS